MQNISSLLTVILLNVLYYVVQNGYIVVTIALEDYRIGNKMEIRKLAFVRSPYGRSAANQYEVLQR